MTTPSPDPFELVGTTIAGKYDVEEIVAQTALSVVYRATHRVWQRRVAIKAFTAPSLSEASRQQLLESFVDEGRLLMDLSERCASICQARDVSSLTTTRGDWVPYTVLEWLDGECLETLLRREREEGVAPRTLAAAIELLNPIADALAVAHERGVVHRDVKPGNIFVLDDGGSEVPRTKLLDFGVAKIMRGATTPPPGAIVSSSFTPSYGAPEQFSAAYGTTGPWTDVFALGLIVVELLAGREALQGDGVGPLAVQSCDPDVRPTARTLGVPVSDAVERVLARALAVRLEDRFANARELWTALRAALHESSHEAVRQAQLETSLETAVARGPSELPGTLEAQSAQSTRAVATADDDGPEIEVAWDDDESPDAVDSDRETASGSIEVAIVDYLTSDDSDSSPPSIPIALNRRRGGAVLPAASALSSASRLITRPMTGTIAGHPNEDIR